MKTHLADQDVTVVVPLRSNGEPIVPDAGSVKFTLRGNDGQVLLANQPVTMAAASTEAVVVIPAAQNGLGAGRFSMRTVRVDFTKSGRPMQIGQVYRLTEWLNTTVTAQDVRDFIGVDAGELPDAVIDIVEAYFDVENDLTETVLTTALTAGDQRQRAANEAVLAQAVIRQLPGLPQRLSQSESNGVFQVARPKIDLERLEARARAMYADAATAASGRFEVEGDLLVVVPLSPDPFTGA